MQGEQEQKKLANKFGFTKQHTSLILRDMEKQELINRHKTQRGYKIAYNKTNPLVKKLNRLVLFAADQKEIINILGEKSSMKVLSQFMKDAEMSMKKLSELTGYTRRTILTATKSLEGKKIISRIHRKPVIYILNKKNSAGAIIWNISQYIFANDIEGLMRNITDEDCVRVSIIYGSQAKEKADDYSDIDLFVVVDTPADRERLMSKYSHPRLDLNVFSKGGFIQMLEREPHFLKLVKEGRILKGEEIVEKLIKD